MIKIYYNIILIELSLNNLDLESYNLNLKGINKIKEELANLKNNINYYIKDIKEVTMAKNGESTKIVK